MSLDSLVVSASDLKFVFVGGKGGVGKTTCSSALATLLSQSNRRVLLISTDPAHSLSDAWKISFSNVPSKVTIPLDGSDTTKVGYNLDVMEVNPQETMRTELEQWASLSQELNNDDPKSNTSSSSMEWHSKLTQFQEWLSGIPGIDEATALSSAIKYIESGKYDIIVFDTAPTGHTVKLLALPGILEQGIDKLQSWQTTFWTYWETFKSGFGKNNISKLKQHVTEKLIRYKRDIQKVAMMLQDEKRTRFVVVCIAEYLSVSETKRLLQELAQCKVVASHIIVNQLLVSDALSETQLSELEEIAKVSNLSLPVELLRKTVNACRLTTARRRIQQRYLNDLKAYAETLPTVEGICEVPLLAEEVTGEDSILRFSKLFVTIDKLPSCVVAVPSNHGSAELLYEDEKSSSNRQMDACQSRQTTSFAPGDVVEITGLASSRQFNGLEGIVVTGMNEETRCYGVEVNYEGAMKNLDVLPQNLVLIRKDQKRQKTGEEVGIGGTVTPDVVQKVKEIFEDSEIKQMVEANPQYSDALKECLANPLSVMKYLGDPAMSPLVTKIMAKL
ncbi:anion-transporting ATPase-domain containing protein [Nitzschia inconspicua]|uniref:Anion-transporting ATPase-domain containing protein n=1 Tax=Nitzschia inconspicua TaxID=303405 RepID=A0A9K3PW30_9STRA|nr:anion-transporting ATPase-domain containing protein [Nitzschia inconspicua]